MHLSFDATKVNIIQPCMADFPIYKLFGDRWVVGDGATRYQFASDEEYALNCKATAQWYRDMDDRAAEDEKRDRRRAHRDAEVGTRPAGRPRKYTTLEGETNQERRNRLQREAWRNRQDIAAGSPYVAGLEQKLEQEKQNLARLLTEVEQQRAMIKGLRRELTVAKQQSMGVFEQTQQKQG